MYALEQKVADTIIGHSLIDSHNPNAVIICALSGGADSVALLGALVSLGYDCVAAHMNFHLRGEESIRDQKHAENIAALLNVPIHVQSADVKKYQRTHNVSIEMACRELRYDWFEQLRTTIGAQSVAVAHNYGDNIETVIMNMIRGTGMAGITGIGYRNNRHIIRPLLQCTRTEIEEYLHVRGLTFVTDSTNMETEFRRNKIRHCVLPAITGAVPDALRGISLTAATVDKQYRLYMHMVNEAVKNLTDDNGNINLRKLREYPYAETLLYEWLKPYGITATQICDILRSTESTGAKFLCKTHTIYINRGYLNIRPVQSPLPFFPFEITEHPITEFAPDGDKNIAYFDASILECGQPLECRYWRDGDRIEPFGMRGSKKVSDLFNNAKISQADKDKIPLLTLGNKILWVAGIRASRHYLVTPATLRYISVKYYK